LSPRIPNYHLQLCHEADPFFQTIKALTLWSSLRCLTHRLWDEPRNVFVGFRHLGADTAVPQLVSETQAALEP
jgi:omega-6 fatty acid desaturase (delta-12 desaturase)